MLGRRAEVKRSESLVCVDGSFLTSNFVQSERLGRRAEVKRSDILGHLFTVLLPFSFDRGSGMI